MIETPKVPTNSRLVRPTIAPPIARSMRSDYSAIPEEITRIRDLPIPNLAMLICHVMNKNGLLLQPVDLSDAPDEFLSGAYMVKEVLRMHETMQPAALLAALDNSFEQFKVTMDLTHKYESPAELQKLAGQDSERIKVVEGLALAYVFLPSHLNDFIL